MINILFVDADNGSRSQMAEALLNKIGNSRFHAHSAGIRAGYKNSYAEEVMREAGADISRHFTKDVMHFVSPNFSFEYIIFLCREKELEPFHVFPSTSTRLHWLFDDPLKFEGPEHIITDQYREQRDWIKKVVKRFVKELEKSGHSQSIADLNFEPAIR